MTCLGAQAVREEGNKALYCPAGLAVALGLSSFYWPLSRVPSQQSHFPKFSKKVVPVSRDLLLVQPGAYHCPRPASLS